MAPYNKPHHDCDHDDGSAATWTAIMDGLDKLIQRIAPVIIIALQLYYGSTNGAKIDTAADKADTAAEVGLSANKTLSAWKAETTEAPADVREAKKAEVMLEKHQEKAANKPQAN